jgi:hypothetical protein
LLDLGQTQHLEWQLENTQPLQLMPFRKSESSSDNDACGLMWNLTNASIGIKQAVKKYSANSIM